MKNSLTASVVFLLFVLLMIPRATFAQATITQGSISTFYTDNSENPPRALYLGFSISGGNTAFLSNDNQTRTATAIIANRQAVRLTYTVEPTQTARGNVNFETYGCINTYLANPNQPLSTRFTTVFADFRAPQFTKTPSQLNSLVEITTTFTMRGRLSCLDQDGTVRATGEIMGAGTATLRFKRTRTNPKQALLVGISYIFSNSSPVAAEVE